MRNALQRIPGKGWSWFRQRPRSRAGTVVLPEETISILREQRARQQKMKELAGSEWVDQDFVFTTPYGTPLDARNVFRRFKKALSDLGLPSIRFHDLRHTAGTLMGVTDSGTED